MRSRVNGFPYRPARHHAKLAVNCAMTLAGVLFGTKVYQAERGLLGKEAGSPEPLARK